MSCFVSFYAALCFSFECCIRWWWWFHNHTNTKCPDNISVIALVRQMALVPVVVPPGGGRKHCRYNLDFNLTNLFHLFQSVIGLLLYFDFKLNLILSLSQKNTLTLNAAVCIKSSKTNRFGGKNLSHPGHSQHQISFQHINLSWGLVFLLWGGWSLD